jgi:hypothetical protein
MIDSGHRIGSLMDAECVDGERNKWYIWQQYTRYDLFTLTANCHGLRASAEGVRTSGQGKVSMSTDLNVEQSGKSGGDAFGWSASGSSGVGGAGTGTMATSSFGSLFGDAYGQGFGGDAGSAASAGGAFGGDVSDNTAIGSINISF